MACSSARHGHITHRHRGRLHFTQTTVLNNETEIKLRGKAALDTDNSTARQNRNKDYNRNSTSVAIHVHVSNSVFFVATILNVDNSKKKKNALIFHFFFMGHFAHFDFHKVQVVLIPRAILQNTFPKSQVHGTE